MAPLLEQGYLDDRSYRSASKNPILRALVALATALANIELRWRREESERRVAQEQADRRERNRSYYLMQTPAPGCNCGECENTRIVHREQNERARQQREAQERDERLRRRARAGWTDERRARMRSRRR